jgi:ribosome-binding factor A
MKRILSDRDKQIRKAEFADGLRDVISTWITQNASRQSLVTVQRVELAFTNKSAKIFISVLPESETDKAMGYLVRHTHELSKYIKHQIPNRMVPFLKFEKSVVLR